MKPLNTKIRQDLKKRMDFNIGLYKYFRDVPNELLGLFLLRYPCRQFKEQLYKKIRSLILESSKK